MDKNARKRLYRAAMEKWGLDLQMGMLMEECAECIQAAHKVKRKETREAWSALAEEMADVLIMIEQISLHVDWQRMEEKVEAARVRKLVRLSETLTRGQLLPQDHSEGEN